MNNDKYNLEKNFISAVVYLNSAPTLEGLTFFLSNLSKVLAQNFKKYEIICLDDNTEEQYIEAVRKICYKYSGTVTILHMSFYQGIELAMNAGRDLAIGDYVIEFDECIWNFPEALIMKAYSEVLKEWDIVCCSDIKKKHITSKWFYSIFNRFAKTQFKLDSDNFRILSRRGINRVCSLSKTIPYRKAIYANCGLKYKVIKYESISEDVSAYSGKALKMRKNLAIQSLLLFTNVGSKIAALMAIVMLVGTVFLATYSLVVYLSGIAMTGWTTTMLFLSFGFFGIFALMAIAIQYLVLILDLIMKKEKYLYESIERL